jgi:DNA-binding CsgD family transcriptional regulator
MGKLEDCAELMEKGLNPREIAEELEISIGSVMNY